LRFRSSRGILLGLFWERGELELRQTWIAPRLRRRIGDSLVRLVAVWLLPVVAVVAVAFAVTRGG
jgi:hypothetical protein